jgi:two-component system KDP operon response regulator KdpE
VSSARILVVDDEPQIRRVLRTTLVAGGYTVRDARSGDEALEKLRVERVDVVLLDMNMPGMRGLETCRMIRSESDVPIIIITVRNAEKDKVEALDAGADDYVTKPFSTPELLARIRASLRRATLASPALPETLELGQTTINFVSRRVTAKGREVRLTPKELELLHYLVSNPDVVLPHARLLQAVWGPDYGEEVEYLRVFVNQLRKKIEPDPSHPEYLLTEPWVGYRLRLSKKGE